MLLCLCACAPGPKAVPPSPAEARRIVSLVPAFTETLFAVGAGDRVVGVSTYCDYPPETQRLPKAGGYHDPNYEAIVTLRPDLVLLSDYRQETMDRLAAFGIAVKSFPHKTVAETCAGIRAIGALAGHAAEGEALAARIEQDIADARAATAGKPRQRVLLVVGRDLADTALREVYVAGPTGFLNELLEAAGGVNVLAEGMAEYPILTAEGILTLKPDRVFEITDDSNRAQVENGAALRAWQDLPHFAPAREGSVHIFCNDYVNIPGPRMVQTLADFRAALEGGAP